MTKSEKNYLQALKENKRKGTLATFEIKVTSGLKADDELSLYRIFNTGDDNTIWVNPTDAKKALEILRRKNLLQI